MISMGDSARIVGPLSEPLVAVLYGICWRSACRFPNEHFVYFPLPVPIKGKIFVIGLYRHRVAFRFGNSGDLVAHFASRRMIFGLLLHLVLAEKQRWEGIKAIARLLQKRLKKWLPEDETGFFLTPEA